MAGPSGKLLIVHCFPQNYLNVSLDSALGNIEISWETKLTVSLGTSRHMLIVTFLVTSELSGR